MAYQTMATMQDTEREVIKLPLNPFDSENLEVFFFFTDDSLAGLSLIHGQGELGDCDGGRPILSQDTYPTLEGVATSDLLLMGHPSQRHPIRRGSKMPNGPKSGEIDGNSYALQSQSHFSLGTHPNVSPCRGVTFEEAIRGTRDLKSV